MPDPMTLPGRVAVVGGGVIGAGWASRFALHGVDVVVADPAPIAGDVVRSTLDDAVSAWDRLDLPRPTPGEVGVVGSLEQAVADAEFVQEAVPERLDLKRSVVADIEAVAGADVVIASSTSGLLPSDLQDGMARPERLVVGHPFNPVYLLPLVEVVGGRSTSEEHLQRAEALYEELGMRPLRVRIEIDAFIADRLMEALWREALWMVNDGVATTEEIDMAITHGFGLRWAQMGVFETYRTAGGPGGLRHFLEQFGPTLDLPWSRLTDVPALDHALVDRIVEQSDAQTGGRDLHGVLRERDHNLVGILRVLESNDWGAGRDLAAMRERLERGGDH